MKKWKCKYCCREFESERKRSVCDDCQIVNMVKKKDKSKDEKPKAKKIKPLSINEAVSIIEKYNRENHTCFTYGNFPHKELFYKKKGE